MDVLAVPTAGTIYTLDQIAAAPVERNSFDLFPAAAQESYDVLHHGGWRAYLAGHTR